MTLWIPSASSLSIFRVLLLQVIVLTLASAFPYVVVPASAAGSSDLAMEKRAFDRLEEHDFGLLKRSLVKRAFDRLDEADFGFRKKRAFDRIARTDFGFRRKRSFDRLGGTEFGLMKKRSIPTDREELIDDLSASILALRHAREVDPLVLLTTPNNDE